MRSTFVTKEDMVVLAVPIIERLEVNCLKSS